jgi:activator of 2-hydroxyglutaryl-CoA dehydratase
VDIGANQTLVVTLGDNHTIIEAVMNQKCSAGLGLMLRLMARRLGMTIEELSELSLDAADGVMVNDGCRVFAELDAIDLLTRVLSLARCWRIVNACL